MWKAVLYCARHVYISNRCDDFLSHVNVFHVIVYYHSKERGSLECTRIWDFAVRMHIRRDSSTLSGVWVKNKNVYHLNSILSFFITKCKFFLGHIVSVKMIHGLKNLRDLSERKFTFVCCHYDLQRTNTSFANVHLKISYFDIGHLYSPHNDSV